MSESTIIRGVSKVAAGSLFVQIGGALGQFIYAAWLSPSDFGLWATASASILLIGALSNAGELNGYLAGPFLGIRDVVPRTIRVNIILSLIACAVGLFHLLQGSNVVAILVLILAIDLPIQGQANLVVAALIKNRLHGQLIASQVIATVVRLIAGILAAWMWNSPLAIGLALLANSTFMLLMGSIFSHRYGRDTVWSDSGPPSPRRLRFDRAIHQFTQVLPTQLDYLVLSAIASPAFLGLYYLAYQGTVAITGVISGPLSKTAMSELSQIARPQRSMVTCRLMLSSTAMAFLGVLIIGLIAGWLGPWLPVRWQPAVAPFVILLAGVPGRLLGPLGEALNTVNGRWRRSSTANIVDALGTAAASLVAITGDVMLVALSISAWKVTYGSVRILIAIESQFARATLGILVPTWIVFITISLAYMHTDGISLIATILVLIVTISQLASRRFIFPQIKSEENKEKNAE